MLMRIIGERTRGRNGSGGERDGEREREREREGSFIKHVARCSSFFLWRINHSLGIPRRYPREGAKVCKRSDSRDGLRPRMLHLRSSISRNRVTPCLRRFPFSRRPNERNLISREILQSRVCPSIYPLIVSLPVLSPFTLPPRHFVAPSIYDRDGSVKTQWGVIISFAGT